MTIHLLFSFTESGKVQLSIVGAGGLSNSIELPADIASLKEQSAAVLSFLLEAYERKASNPLDQKVDENNVTALTEKGRTIFKTLFGPHSDAVNFPPDSLLSISLPESLRFVPLELLHSGDQFWAVKYGIVRSRPSSSLSEQSITSAFYGYNPSNDPLLLDSEEFKGRLIPKAFKSAFPSVGEPRMKHGSALSKAYFMEMLSNKDIMIFTGHGEPNHIPFADTMLEADQLAGARTDNVRLFLNNSCFSADPNGKLLPAFLASGIQNYSGYLSNVPQDAAARFAASFLDYSGKGFTVAEAALLARQASYRREPGSLVWANSVIYGNADTVLGERTSPSPVRRAVRRFRSLPIAVQYSAVAGLIVIIALAAIGLSGILQTRSSERQVSEKIDTLHTDVSDLLKALKAQGTGLVQSPSRPQDFLINAQLYAAAGDYAKSKASFLKYFEFGQRYIEPHVSFQNILKDSEGISSAKAFYDQRASSGDPFDLYLLGLLDDNPSSRKQAMEAIRGKHPDFGPARGELLRLVVRESIEKVRNHEVWRGEDSTAMGDALRSARTDANSAVSNGTYLKYFIDRTAAKDFGLNSVELTFLQSYAKDFAAEQRAMNADRKAFAEKWTKDNLLAGINTPAFIKPVQGGESYSDDARPVLGRAYDSAKSYDETIRWFQGNFAPFKTTRNNDGETLDVDLKDGRLLSIIVSRTTWSVMVNLNVTAYKPDEATAVKAWKLKR